MNEYKTDYVSLSQPFKDKLDKFNLDGGKKHALAKWIERIIFLHVECIKVHMDLPYILRQFPDGDDTREDIICEFYGLLRPFNDLIQDTPNPLNCNDKLWESIQRLYQGLSERLVKE